MLHLLLCEIFKICPIKPFRNHQRFSSQYFKPCPVCYALRDKVAAELSQLEKEGALKKVESSDWATPIVPVLQPDGTVRICGDFKVT